MPKREEWLSYCVMERHLEQNFAHDFSNLASRIRNLNEALCNYYKSGDFIGIGPVDGSGPKICVVRFPHNAAIRYEKACEKFLSKRYPYPDGMKKPDFSVDLSIDVSGSMEERTFDFRCYCRPYLKEFCEELCALARSREKRE